MNKFLKIIVMIALTANFATGCAVAVNKATANVEPKAKLTTMKKMYVKRLPEDDTVYNLIVKKLETKGIKVTTGTADGPTDVDAVVTYIDKWMWDMTTYLLELTVTIREPKTNYPIATANSMHTSLTRLSPQEMVDEVIDNIYKKAH